VCVVGGGWAVVHFYAGVSPHAPLMNSLSGPQSGGVEQCEVFLRQELVESRLVPTDKG